MVTALEYMVIKAVGQVSSQAPSKQSRGSRDREMAMPSTTLPGEHPGAKAEGIVFL